MRPASTRPGKLLHFFNEIVGALLARQDFDNKAFGGRLLEAVMLGKLKLTYVEINQAVATQAATQAKAKTR